MAAFIRGRADFAVVGIDIGMTSYAVAYSTQSGTVNLCSFCARSKEPTTMLMCSDQWMFGKDAQKEYLEFVYDDTEKEQAIPLFCHSFKSGLLGIRPGESYQGIYVQDRNGSAQASLLRVYTEWLRFLSDRASAEVGTHFHDANSNLERIVWILMIPASTPEAAKLLLRQAACEAGLVDRDRVADPFYFDLVSEPEAVAVAASFHHVPGDDVTELSYREGKRFCVVDCGGGPTDVRSFEVRKAAPDLQLSDLNFSSTIRWGAEQINVNFARFLLSLLQRVGGTLAEDTKTTRAAVWQQVLWEFEKAKVLFPNSEVSVCLSALLTNTEVDRFRTVVVEYNKTTPAEPALISFTRSKYLKMSNDLVAREFFEPILCEIENGVQNALRAAHLSEKPINEVVVVGGFASSDLLQKRLRSKLSELHPAPQFVTFPSLGSSAHTAAIVGATRRGLLNQTRACQLTSGGTLTERSYRPFDSQQSDFASFETHFSSSPMRGYR